MEYITMDGDTAVIHVSGRYDLIKTAYVDKELKEAINTHNCKKITVDFSDTTFSDSAVNRQLKRAYDMVGGKDNFKIVNCKGAVLKALQTANLDKFFHIVA